MLNLKNFLKNQSENFLFKKFPFFFLDMMNSYFRLEVEDIEHIPKRGRALLVSNHSGVSGLDAMLIAAHVNQSTGRYLRILTHTFWFLHKFTQIPAEKLGFIKATYENGVRSLNKNNLVLIFPEGESGNFKPTIEAYQLQEFRRGFVRMALETEAPIIPVMVIGAEETHINLAQLSVGKWVKGLSIPLPLNLIPLPSKWKIVFMPPIYLPYSASQVNDVDLVRELAEDLQEKMQANLNRLLEQRKTIFK